MSVSPRGVRGLLSGLALVAAFLLAVSEFLPLYELVTAGPEPVRRTVRGAANHAFAMLLFAAAAVPLALGARRGARAAMVGLALLGVVVVAVVLTVDLPAVRGEGTVREAGAFAEATLRPRAGFFVETLGAVLLLVSGGGMLLAGGDAPRRVRERERGGLADAT